ncbi:hypothetical protein MMC22_010049 [Lobaria immixta]|nr:hypothetical protein [Lobaria immixta]
MLCSVLLSPVILIALLIVPARSTPFNGPGLDFWHPPLPVPVKVIHQFPVGTWMENLAVRRNGKILTTALSSPEIFQVDNHGVQPVKLVHTFPDATSCTGIAKLGRDVFYVIAGSLSLNTFNAVPGSWSVYRVDVRHHHPHTTKPKPAKVSLVASFPDSVVLNGITVLNKHKKWFLVSDSGAGVVYRLDAKKGKVFKVLEDPLMKPDSPSFGNGLSGIKIKRDQLYFTNNNQNLLARMTIADNGTSKATAKVVTDVDGPADFTFNGRHNVVIAQNGVDRLGLMTKNHSVVQLAGSPTNGAGSDYELFGPTAVQFGKIKRMDPAKADWMKAYMSTNGGTAQYLTGNVTRGGTISVVDIRSYAASAGLSTILGG